MNDSIDKCVVNCLRCRRGSYPLFRGFGLDATDQVGRIRRAQVQQQVSAYFPDITDVRILQMGRDEYRVNIRGYVNEN